MCFRGAKADNIGRRRATDNAKLRLGYRAVVFDAGRIVAIDLVGPYEIAAEFLSPQFFDVLRRPRQTHIRLVVLFL